MTPGLALHIGISRGLCRDLFRDVGAKGQGNFSQQC